MFNYQFKMSIYAKPALVYFSSKVRRHYR